MEFNEKTKCNSNNSNNNSKNKSKNNSKKKNVNKSNSNLKRCKSKINSENLDNKSFKNIFYNNDGIESICDDYTETNEVINHLLFNVKNNKNLSLKSEELVSCVLKINEYRTYINSYITRFIRHNEIINIMSMMKIKNKQISVIDISKSYKLSKTMINDFNRLESLDKEEKLLNNENNIQQIIALFVYINYKLVIGELNF